MSKHKFILTVLFYATITTYPAYCQVSTWTNQALDEFANNRVEQQKQAKQATAKQVDDNVFAVLEKTIPSHLLNPLPVSN